MDLLIALRQNAAENFGWLIASLTLASVFLLVLWRWGPALIERTLYWLDEQFPGDFSALHRPLSLLFTSALSLVILAAAGLSLAGGLSDNMAVTQAILLATAERAGGWLLDRGLKILLILLLALFLKRLAFRAIPKAVTNYIRTRESGEPEAEVEKDARTISTVVGKATGVVIGFGALFMTLAQLGIELGPLLAAAGVVGIAVGFGAQTFIRDVIAGFFIILEKQYRVGDVASIAGIGGLVEDINLRRTVLRDLDYTQHFIPNGEVRTASNLTKGKSRVNLNIPVAYKEDLDRVIAVLNEIGQEMAKDPIWGSLILAPPQVLRVDKFADSAVEIKVLGETLPIRQWDVMGEYRLRTKRIFDRLGIEIPYPHRTLYWGGQPSSPVMERRREPEG
ncbi:MAG: mechanosensitive ion channel family protein [Chloroflexi bacterium]|nr:mechanosensitive ion channel family protein [Chloroflexota bacterium]